MGFVFLVEGAGIFPRRESLEIKITLHSFPFGFIFMKLTTGCNICVFYNGYLLLFGILKMPEIVTGTYLLLETAIWTTNREIGTTLNNWLCKETNKPVNGVGGKNW